MVKKQYIKGCKTKKYYDTEFEAIVAAAKTEGDVGAPMKHYKCPEGRHYHVTNVDRSKRNRHLKHYRCPHCKNIINEQKNPNHYRKCKMKP